MKTNFAIADMLLVDLQPNGSLLTIVSEHDPLLRRFGQVDVVSLAPGHPLTVLRSKADEVWTILEGQATFSLTDRREDSPTFGQQATLTLDSQAPQAVLVPFGTECRVEAESAARLLRLTTHADDTDPQDILPAV